MWGVSITPRPLFTPGKDPVPIVQEAGWAPGPVWTGAEDLAPTGIRSLDRPARSQSRYRLHCPAHDNVDSTCIIFYVGESIGILPQSPGRTPMGFFFWRVVKDLVYTVELTTLEEINAFRRRTYQWHRRKWAALWDGMCGCSGNTLRVSQFSRKTLCPIRIANKCRDCVSKFHLTFIL